MPGRAGRIPQFQLGVVSQAWNPSTCKVEAGGPDVESFFGYIKKYKASLSGIIYLKKYFS